VAEADQLFESEILDQILSVLSAPLQGEVALVAWERRSLMASVIKSDDLIVGREVSDLMPPVLPATNQTIAKQERSTRTFDLVEERRPIARSEEALFSGTTIGVLRRRVWLRRRFALGFLG
jgi:hypothetical protein